jgi:hypothetical protein
LFFVSGALPAAGWGWVKPMKLNRKAMANRIGLIISGLIKIIRYQN